MNICDGKSVFLHKNLQVLESNLGTFGSPDSCCFVDKKKTFDFRYLQQKVAQIVFKSPVPDSNMKHKNLKYFMT